MIIKLLTLNGQMFKRIQEILLILAWSRVYKKTDGQFFSQKVTGESFDNWGYISNKKIIK